MGATREEEIDPQRCEPGGGPFPVDEAVDLGADGVTGDRRRAGRGGSVTGPSANRPTAATTVASAAKRRLARVGAEERGDGCITTDETTPPRRGTWAHGPARPLTNSRRIAVPVSAWASAGARRSGG